MKKRRRTSLVNKDNNDTTTTTNKDNDDEKNKKSEPTDSIEPTTTADNESCNETNKQNHDDGDDNANANYDDDQLNCENISIESNLNEQITNLLNSLRKKENDLNINEIIKLKSFKSFESLTKAKLDHSSNKSTTSNLNETNKNKLKRILNLFKKLISYWDILILLTLNLIFATYLSVFLTSYYSPKSSIAKTFTDLNDKAIRSIARGWLRLNGFTDLTKEECAIVLPDFCNSLFRPIDDCSMCVNLNQIERVENISKEEFLAKYAYTAVPVIITDAMKDWKAMNVLNFDFLRDLYLNSDEENYKKRQQKVNIHKNGKKSSPILNTFNSIVETDEMRREEKDTCQFFPYKTKFKSLREVFEMNVNDGSDGDGDGSDGGDGGDKWDKPWYVGWSNCNSYAAQILRELYKRPYFLPDDSEMSRLDWIFMGTPKYGANMHIDDVNNPSWQAQIRGDKLWTFMPPAECSLKCSTLYTTVYPGDVIVFDSNRWFHSTEIIGDEISLTIGSEYD